MIKYYNSMHNGHIGKENKQVKRKDSRNFHLALSCLIINDYEAEFIIHAQPSTFTLFGSQPAEILKRLGFQEYQEECNILEGRECLFRPIYRVNRDKFFDNIQEIEFVRSEFNKFAKSIDTIIEQIQEIDRKLLSLKFAFPWIVNYIPEPPVLDLSGKEPSWLDKYKPKKLIEIEKNIKNLTSEKQDLSSYLLLLYSSGDTLENVVKKTLESFGLIVEKTRKGSTIDLIAYTEDKNKIFGIEVTGTSHGIRKNNPKLTQIMTFDMQKEDKEKPILLANTYKDLDPEERRGKEHFTKQVIEYLEPHGILLITTFDLYNLWLQMYEGKLSKKEIIEKLYNQKGIFKL